MPSRTEAIQTNEQDHIKIMSRCYGAAVDLAWDVTGAFENKIVAQAHGTFTGWKNKIQLNVSPGLVNIETHTTGFLGRDLFGRNKKILNDFQRAFEKSGRADEKELSVWTGMLNGITAETNSSMAEQKVEAEELEDTMRLGSGNRYFTYGIIAVNVLLFLLMVVSGVSIFQPTVEDLLRWGGNFPPYTLGGEWWRLLTNIFVHIGIIHLLFNMYALLYVGIFLEPMMGKARYVTAYLSTGIFASLASAWWHNDHTVSAGASGAIFGLYGVFIALLTTSLIPKSVRKGLFQSMGIFVAYNLIYGMRSGVDNAAHVGGLVSGMMIGYVLYFTLRKERTLNANMAIGIISLATLVCAMLYVKGNEDDSKKFDEAMNRFAEYEKDALQPLRNTQNMSAADFKEMLQTKSMENWENCKRTVDQMESYRLPDRLVRYKEGLKQYIELRMEQTKLFIEAQDAPDGTYEDTLSISQQKIEAVMKKLQGN
jgi:membrane associated rhomboid family serine protease